MYLTPIPYWQWQRTEAPPHTNRSRSRTQQDNPVRQVAFRFQCRRTAVNERFTPVQGGTVIQQSLASVYRLIPQQAETPRFRNSTLPGEEKNVW